MGNIRFLKKKERMIDKQDGVENMLSDWAVLVIEHGINLEEFVESIRIQVQKKEEEWGVT
jgi:hypothetical protein